MKMRKMELLTLLLATTLIVGIAGAQDTGTAMNIAPANGAELVALDTNLVWGPPLTFTPTKYDLSYKIGDPNFATAGAIVVTDIARTDPCNVYDLLTDFANNTEVYWRVDSYAPSYPSDPCIGNVWSFTTEPIILEDPCGLTINAGETAVFRVKATNGSTYLWKMLDNPDPPDNTGSTLTITNVQKANEGVYYCRVTNPASVTAYSAWVNLMTKRLVARWEFDDSLDAKDDEEATCWPGVYTDPNLANDQPDPCYVTDPCSIDGGKALQLAADVFHVRITNSADFFNFYPQGHTVNAWVKTEQDSVFGCIASKQYRAESHPTDSKGWVLNCNDTGRAVHGLRQVFGSTSGNIVGTSNIADNEWHMVTATYDAETGTGSVYVDGLLQNQLVDTLTEAPTNVYPVVLGSESVLGEFAAYEGLLDKASIYSYALSPLDVAVLYTDMMTGESVCVEESEYDLDGDCRVNLLDFAMFATDWMECNSVPDCLP